MAGGGLAEQTPSQKGGQESMPTESPEDPPSLAGAYLGLLV